MGFNAWLVRSRTEPKLLPLLFPPLPLPTPPYILNFWGGYLRRYTDVQPATLPLPLLIKEGWGSVLSLGFVINARRRKKMGNGNFRNPAPFLPSFLSNQQRRRQHRRIFPSSSSHFLPFLPILRSSSSVPNFFLFPRFVPLSVLRETGASAREG